MEKAFTPLLPLLISIPVLMAALSFIKFRRHKKIEFLHLSLFFLSMATEVMGSWFLWPLGPAFTILSLFPWLWTLNNVRTMIEDITKVSLLFVYHYFAIALAAVTSIVFLSFDFSLPIVVTPFSLAIGLIGMTFIFHSYLKGDSKDFGHLHHLNFFFLFTYFVTRIFFPIMIEEAWSAKWALIGQFYLLIVMCCSLFPLYAEIVFERHERDLEEIVLSRNRQLFSHSSFSEYKILSAGLGHEVNNALTIINAKIAQILRGRNVDLERDLRVMQNAANRIVKGVRGLREFIYPYNQEEILDVGDLIEDVINLYGQRLTNHGVKIDLQDVQGKLVMGKKVPLEQVFLSLINNSVEALDNLDDKWVKVQARTTGGQVQIFYSDSGLFKSREISSLLVNPMMSVKEFRDDDIRLVLVNEIIEAHGGTLQCGQNGFDGFVISLPQAHAIKSTEADLRGKIEEINQSLH